MSFHPLDPNITSSVYQSTSTEQKNGKIEVINESLEETIHFFKENLEFYLKDNQQKQEQIKEQKKKHLDRMSHLSDQLLRLQNTNYELQKQLMNANYQIDTLDSEKHLLRLDLKELRENNTNKKTTLNQILKNQKTLNQTLKNRDLQINNLSNNLY
ncbi:centrosome-associated protein cep250 [Anaeramoeba flamelloides]|uniref:Centrosome-associated protein cep250 n=1 Tax=Anaeramoeba flamelloides TaxID=1746091 RepID=A0AAV7Z5D8_9EUKA|nr:centrosome-associated protein cep250 [Anaeramoeba flamelloides]